ncbi:hypothetical protein TL16_g10503 [Triparma laevis f. inornata]|uniref:Uncharacterized protein n=1 Tax=Triparma laevis f. inornata TaxID=1714386 RepID=A0A9W7BGJ8_9STRA|nr:hypothetical protein TL16_g10503 [Triparma laevis f. inornata]
MDDGSSRPPAKFTQSRHNFDHLQQQQQQHSMYQQRQHGGNHNHDASSLYDTSAPDAAPLQHSWSEPSNSGDSNRGHHHLQQQQSAAYAQLQARMLAQQQQLYQKQQEELEQQQRMQREQLKKRQETQQQEFMLQQQQLIQSYAPPPAVSGPTPILPQAPERGEGVGEGRVSSQSQGSAGGGVETTWEKTPPTEGRNLSNPSFPLWSAGGEGGGVIGAGGGEGGGEGEGAKKQGGGISDLGELLPSSS